jgi:hypothetical protein
MANALYDKGRQAFLEGSIAYLTDTIKVALVTNGYTPNLSTHQFYSDLTPGSNVVGTPPNTRLENEHQRRGQRRKRHLHGRHRR